MINITDFYHYYNNSYDAYFDSTDMLEYKEDVLRFIVSQTFEMIHGYDLADIQEAVSINIRQYFQDEFIESSEVDEVENDSYVFMYQYNIMDMLYNTLKSSIENYTKSNGVFIEWSEDVNISFLNPKDTNEWYITFENNTIVRYTDFVSLGNSSVLAKTNRSILIDTENDYLIFKSIVEEFDLKLFYASVEFFISEKVNGVEYKERYLKYVLTEYYDLEKQIVDVDKIINLLKKYSKYYNLFNGWVRNTFKLRVTYIKDKK